MTTSPLGRALGDSTQPPACKVLADDISVHWYPQGATPGDACLCGKTVMKEDL